MVEKTVEILTKQIFNQHKMKITLYHHLVKLLEKERIGMKMNMRDYKLNT